MIAAIKKRRFICRIGPDNQVRQQAPAEKSRETEENNYQKGYVQVCYKDGAKMCLTGTLEALKHSRNHWVALAMSINTIELNLIDTSDKAPLFNNSPNFKFPDELTYLDKLIAG